MLELIPLTDGVLQGSGSYASYMEAKKQAGLMDRVEVEMLKLPSVEAPVTHRFTPHLYTREILMRKGSLILSKIHKTEHPFFILQGDISVWMDGEVVRLKAPHIGITKPGTQRVLFAHEDTRWATTHVTDETDLKLIEEQIIEPHDNPLLTMPPEFEQYLEGGQE